MIRSLNRLLLASAVGMLAVGAAQAADLPTKKTAPAPAAPNCYASLWSWLDSSPADCPLSLYGVTVYGAIDLGGGYETAAARFNKDLPQGVSELISKFNNGARWQWVPNGLSQSNVGVKIREQVAPNWFIVGDVNLGFDPYSFDLASGPKSLVDNNFSTLFYQTANSDSSRAGQWDNTRAFLGVSNTTFGTLTAGRQYAFTNDLVNSYDPFGGAYAFSLIGYSSSFVAGTGDTETARENTSVKYQVAYNGFRAGALAQLGGWDQGNGAQSAYQVDIGGDYRRLLGRRHLRLREGRRRPGELRWSGHFRRRSERHAEGDARRRQRRRLRRQVQMAGFDLVRRLRIRAAEQPERRLRRDERQDRRFHQRPQRRLSGGHPEAGLHRPRRTCKSSGWARNTGCLSNLDAAVGYYHAWQNNIRYADPGDGLLVLDRLQRHRRDRRARRTRPAPATRTPSPRCSTGARSSASTSMAASCTRTWRAAWRAATSRTTTPPLRAAFASASDRGFLVRSRSLEPRASRPGFFFGACDALPPRAASAAAIAFRRGAP